MCHHHHGLTGFINGLTQNTEDFSSASRVEGARRFVCKHYGWVANQRPGNCDTLLLSARKMHRIAGSLVGQPHQIEHLTHSGIINTYPVEPQMQSHVFYCSEIRNKEIILDHHPYMSTTKFCQSGVAPDSD